MNAVFEKLLKRGTGIKFLKEIVKFSSVCRKS